MKKSMLVLVLVALGLLIVALPANAAYFTINTHGGWGNSTAGCADCHTTHAASAAYLLASGPTQTDACFACHGNAATNSPYDVYNGAMSINYTYVTGVRTYWDTGSIYPSYAGGFKNSYNFSRANNNDHVLNNLTTGFAASASVHNVEGAGIINAGGTGWNDDLKIPGGTAKLSATQAGSNLFKCGSCHDPHGGTNSNTDARLLRKNLPANSNTVVTFGTAASTVDTTTYRITEYPEAINTWCGGCHDFFDAPDAAGHTANGGYYRHPMGVSVDQAVYNNISYGTPLAKTSNELTCFSCHRAHGTVSTATGAAASFKGYYNGALGAGSGSVLLRMSNRDVCYSCHGAADVNTYTYYAGGGGGASHTAH